MEATAHVGHASGNLDARAGTQPDHGWKCDRTAASIDASTNLLMRMVVPPNLISIVPAAKASLVDAGLATRAGTI